MTTTEILLVLYAVVLGTTFGAGLYEARVIIPLWFPQTSDKTYLSNTNNQRDIDSGRRFWGMLVTGPLTLITLANVYFAFRSAGEIRAWWLTASLTMFIERIATFSFFIPTLIKLQEKEGLLAQEIDVLIFWWIRMNYLRSFSTLIALIMILKALTLA